jgi:ankyrin repeat protein
MQRAAKRHRGNDMKEMVTRNDVQGFINAVKSDTQSWRQIVDEAQGENVIMYCARLGRLEMIKCLMPFVDEKQRNVHGATLLHIAALEGHLPVMKWLVNSSFYFVNEVTTTLVTPLWISPNVDMFITQGGSYQWVLM